MNPAQTVKLARAAHPRAWALAGAATLTASLAGTAPLLIPTFTTGLAIVIGAVAGILCSAGLTVHRRLTVMLGALTAVAALAVICSGALSLIVLTFPHCPGGGVAGGPTPGRCGAVDVGTWMTIGAVVPAMFAILLGGPVILGKIVLRVARLVRRTPARAGNTSTRPTGRAKRRSDWHSSHARKARKNVRRARSAQRQARRGRRRPR